MLNRFKLYINTIFNKCDQDDLIDQIKKDLVAAKQNLLWAHATKEDAEHNIATYNTRVMRLTETLKNEEKINVNNKETINGK